MNDNQRSSNLTNANITKAHMSTSNRERSK